ncbi:hypothetical protein SNEBB_000075 [Seison nebaliae]|nr:hypothetical protein SNEBB_000075 [Seison nebaliae]
MIPNPFRIQIYVLLSLIVFLWNETYCHNHSRYRRVVNFQTINSQSSRSSTFRKGFDPKFNDYFNYAHMNKKQILKLKKQRPLPPATIAKTNKFDKAYKYCIQRPQYVLPRFEELLYHILQDYSKETPPVMEDGQTNGCPINMQIDMKIEQIFNVNEVQQSMVFMAEIYMRWTDKRLSWNPADYPPTNISWAFIPKNKIWLPDIYLYENTARAFAVEILPRSYLLLKHDGSIRYNTPLITETRCFIDVANFPYDREICNISMGSYAMDDRYIRLQRTERLTKNSDQLYENDQWKIISFTPHSFFIRDPQNNNFSVVSFEIVIERKPLFYMTYLVSPVVFMLILSPGVFLIPVESGERVSYSVTLLLTVMIFLQIIMQLMPKSSTETAKISLFYLTVISESALALIVNILIINTYHRAFLDLKKSNAPRWWLLRIGWILSIFSSKRRFVPKYWKPVQFWTNMEHETYYDEIQQFKSNMKTKGTNHFTDEQSVLGNGILGEDIMKKNVRRKKSKNTFRLLDYNVKVNSFVGSIVPNFIDNELHQKSLNRQYSLNNDYVSKKHTLNDSIPSTEGSCYKFLRCYSYSSVERPSSVSLKQRRSFQGSIRDRQRMKKNREMTKQLSKSIQAFKKRQRINKHDKRMYLNERKDTKYRSDSVRTTYTEKSDTYGNYKQPNNKDWLLLAAILDNVMLIFFSLLCIAIVWFFIYYLTNAEQKKI